MLQIIFKIKIKFSTCYTWHRQSPDIILGWWRLRPPVLRPPSADGFLRPRVWVVSKHLNSIDSFFKCLIFAFLSRLNHITIERSKRNKDRNSKRTKTKMFRRTSHGQTFFVSHRFMSFDARTFSSSKHFCWSHILFVLKIDLMFRFWTNKKQIRGDPNCQAERDRSWSCQGAREGWEQDRPRKNPQHR